VHTHTCTLPTILSISLSLVFTRTPASHYAGLQMPNDTYLPAVQHAHTRARGHECVHACGQQKMPARLTLVASCTRRAINPPTKNDGNAKRRSSHTAGTMNWSIGLKTSLPPTCATTRFRPAYIFSSTQHNNDDDLDVSINLAEGQKKAAHSTLHTHTHDPPPPLPTC
jgi:hypothetical protein